MSGVNPHGKKALVTGASRGLGRYFAEELVHSGYEVWGTSRNPSTVTWPEGIKPLALDLSNTTSLAGFLQEHADFLGSIDVLVNNAGSGVFGEIARTRSEDIEMELSLLLSGPIQLSRKVFDTMTQRGEGTIVNVSSLAAELPIPLMPIYSAAKSALSTFSAGLMIEASVRCPGVAIIDFRPGDFRTEFNASTRRPSDLSPFEEKIWRAIRHNLEVGARPEVAAARLAYAVHRGRSGVVRTGTFFQRIVAPLGVRLLPESWMRRLILGYYNGG